MHAVAILQRLRYHPTANRTYTTDEEVTVLAKAVPTSHQALTMLDVLRKAASYKGLELHENASRACSKPIKEYALDQQVLAILAERTIVRQARPDCREEIFTIVDENPQAETPGFRPSNYWNFKRSGAGGDFDLRITLSVEFAMTLRKRGITLVPQARGTFVSASDALPNFRMFKALTQNDPHAPAVAKELSESDGTIVVTWTELGLGGIRSLAELFREFAAGNELVARLGDGDVFDPVPHPRNQPLGDELYILEPAQPRILETWRAQLDEYRARLVV